MVYDFSSLAGVTRAMRDLNIGGFVSSTTRKRNDVIERCFRAIYRLQANLTDALIAFVDNLKVNGRNVGFNLTRSIAPSRLTRLVWISSAPPNHFRRYFGLIGRMPCTAASSVFFRISDLIGGMARSVFFTMSRIPSPRSRSLFFKISEPIRDVLSALCFSVFLSPNRCQRLLTLTTARLQPAQARFVLGKLGKWLLFVTLAALFHARNYSNSSLRVGVNCG